MAFCSMCGAQIADGTTCVACAARMSAAAAAPAGAGAPAAAVPLGGMADNVAGMLAYFTFVPAIIFLVIEPYNKNRFVRFHAWQSIFFCLGMVAVWIAYVVVAAVLAVIPILGHVVNLLLWAGVLFGEIIIWVILVVKANSGQMWKLPVVGDLAEKQANAM
jgi:uncharacterized membrane protein